MEENIQFYLDKNSSPVLNLSHSQLLTAEPKSSQDIGVSKGAISVQFLSLAPLWKILDPPLRIFVICRGNF